MERHEHLAALEERLYEAVPPIHPGYQWWLLSDASYSYCYDCVDTARGWEFELGRPLRAPLPFEHTDDYVDAFYAGIDGGFQTTGDERTRACHICGRTLDYTLTDYGVDDELVYYAENPGFTTVGPEETYAISRICMNLTWGGAPADKVEAAIAIVEQALVAIIQQKEVSP